DRDLRGGGAGEGRAAHFGNHFGDVPAGDFHAQDIIPAVLVQRQSVTLGAAAQNIICPDASVEDSIWMDDVDTDALATPLQRGHARKLVQGRLGSRVRGGAWARRRHILGADHHYTTTARRTPEQWIRRRQQHQVCIQVYFHDLAPLV